jgi:hypothetical protein
MAVSQADRVKNPYTVPARNSFAASQPPGSAPAAPVMHVMEP